MERGKHWDRLRETGWERSGTRGERKRDIIWERVGDAGGQTKGKRAWVGWKRKQCGWKRDADRDAKRDTVREG